MPAGKIFALSFVLGGSLANSFSNAMSQGAGKLQRLQSRVASLNTQEKELSKSFNEAQRAMNHHESTMSFLNEQYKAGSSSQRQYNTLMQETRTDFARASMEANRYSSQLQRVQRELKNATTEMNAMNAVSNAKQKFDSAIGDFRGTLGTIGMISAPIAGAVKYSMDFEAAMAKVKAISGASAAEMVKLNEQAEKLGETTPYTATQAAEAMTYLGMAGWNTTQILAGMPSMLNLATASGADLATVADILSDDLTAFGMSAEQAAHMADVFAAASTNSNTNVEKMGETFKYAGSVAGALGYKLEDVAIATGLMASASIKGEQAGTSLRAMMQRLVAPPTTAAKAMDALGISVKNSDGSVKPFIETIKDLREKFAGLSESEKAEKASAIAGMDAISGFLAVVNASDADFNKLTNAINNADGACDSMAATMHDNLQGDMQDLQSAAQSVAISVGKALTPNLREMAKCIIDVTRGAGAWVKQHQELIANLGTVAAGIASGVVAMQGYKVIRAVFGRVGTGVQLFALRIKSTASEVSKFLSIARGLTWGGVMGKIASAFSAARGVVASFAGKFVSAFSFARGTLTGFIGVLRGLGTGGLIQGTVSAMQGLSVAIRGVGGAMLGIARAGIATMFSPIGIAVMALAAAAYYCYTNWSTVGPMLAGLWGTIQTAFTDAWTMLQPALQGLFDAFGTLSAIVGENSGIFATLAEILGGAVVGAFITVATVAVNVLATGIGVIASMVTGLMGVFTGLIQFITGVFTGDWTAAWEGVKNIFSSIFTTIGNIADRILGGIKNTLSNIANTVGKIHIGGGGSEVAHNAQGGIYNKGAFLTTFAEDGPEAAIPLDGSQRAVSLWQRAGEILGMFPENTPVGGFTKAPARQEMTPYTMPISTQQTPGYMDTVSPMAKTQSVAVTNEHNSHVDASRTVNNSRVDNSRTVDNSRVDASRTVDNSHVDSSQTVSNSRVDASRTVNNNQRYESNSSTTKLIERFAPPPITINITVNGEAKVERIKEAVVDAGRQMQRSFAEQMEEFMHNRGRLSFG